VIQCDGRGVPVVGVVAVQQLVAGDAHRLEVVVQLLELVLQLLDLHLLHKQLLKVTENHGEILTCSHQDSNQTTS